MESLIHRCAYGRVDSGRVLSFESQLKYSLNFHSKKGEGFNSHAEIPLVIGNYEEKAQQILKRQVIALC